MGVKTVFVDCIKLENLKAAITPETKITKELQQPATCLKWL